MASELKHDFPIIIKKISMAFSSTVAKNIKAFVKLIKVFPRIKTSEISVLILKFESTKFEEI